MREQIIQQTEKNKVIAIIRGVEPDKALKTVQALYDGGIRMLEVTFDPKRGNDQSVTADIIREICEYFQGKVYVGAGTVTSPEMVEIAAKAGALFIISPNTSKVVIEKTRELGLVSMPGALTPTEIVEAHSWGADFVKLFPAGSMGTGYVKAIKAPLNHIKLLAVGGVGPDNITEFLEAGCCGAGIGGNLVNKKWIDAGEYEKITETARNLVDKIEKWRK